MRPAHLRLLNAVQRPYETGAVPPTAVVDVATSRYKYEQFGEHLMCPKVELALA